MGVPFGALLGGFKELQPVAERVLAVEPASGATASSHSTACPPASRVRASSSRSSATKTGCAFLDDRKGSSTPRWSCRPSGSANQAPPLPASAEGFFSSARPSRSAKESRAAPSPPGGIAIRTRSKDGIQRSIRDYYEPQKRKEHALPEYDPLADLYDLEYGHDYDLPFWLTLAEREPGPVVEWGAGTGRVAGPLALAGHDVTAVEVSGAMVERGRKKGSAVEWAVGDMRSAKLGRRFGLAVCAFNSFLCLTSVEDALAFLRNAGEHLLPGGLLGLEVSAFSPEELAGEPELRHDSTRGLPDGGTLDRLSVSRYDQASQILGMRLRYERYDAAGELQSKRAHDLGIRVIGRAELELMLRLAGLMVEAVYGGFEGEPFDAGSDHLIVLARREV